MRNIISVSVIVVCVSTAFYSCNKKDGELSRCERFHNNTWGHSSALTNYGEWNVFANMGVGQNGRISLYFWKIPDTIIYCEFTETLFVNNLPVSLGEVPLQYTTVADRLKPNETPSAVYITHAGGYDTTSEQYNLEEGDRESVVAINYIAPDTSEIRGTYNLYFVHDTTMPGKSDPNRPDTLEFIHGSFKAFRIQ